MREMGLKSLTVIVSADLGKSTIRASLTLCKFLVSKCQKVSKATMTLALIIGQTACKNRLVKPSGPGALSGGSNLMTPPNLILNEMLAEV
jgi:hypothetical protein